LSKKEIDILDQVIKRKKTLQRGDYLLREGDEFKSILAIKSGTAKLIATDTHGNEHILNILLPGELLGFDGIHKSHHSCSVIALETLSFCELPVSNWDELADIAPGLMRELLLHAGEKMDEDHNKIILSKRPADERLAYFLLNLSNRYKRRGFSTVEFTLTLSRQELANHLGLALETVSRLLKKFQETGLIAVKNKHIQIKDMSALQNLQGIKTS
jgi:CRP/FNR family transcriptional regulator